MTSSPISSRRSTPSDPQARGSRAGPGAGEFLLPMPFQIDLALTVASHGWAYLAPWRWDPEAGILARAERLDGRYGTVAVRQGGPEALAIRYDGLDSAAQPEISRSVRRWLSADWDPAEAIAALGEDGVLIGQGGGRLLRCSSFYEDFVKTVLTINTAWSSTCRMAAALVAEPGGGAFPDPEAVLDYGEVRLRERAKLGFRAATIISATRRMLEDGAIDQAGEGRPDYEYLIGLYGIGPYSAAHCRLLLHDFSRIPVDSVVTAYLRERHATDPAAFAASRAEWGAFLALGYRLTRLRERLDSVR
jgi:3-methyladenine DNA glycosylase/8-oxoguanine DNA glycosylase